MPYSILSAFLRIKWPHSSFVTTIGRKLETPVCTRKEGNPTQQTMDFEELEKKNVANNSSDFDETFYGDETFDPSELDEEGFADLNMDDEYNNM